MLSQEPRRRVTVGSRAVQEALDGTHQRQRFPNSWNVTFTLITARDNGVPPYSMNRHRLFGDAAHLVPDRLAVVWEVGVDEHDAGVRHENGRVFAGTRNHVQVVADVLYPAGPGDTRALFV